MGLGLGPGLALAVAVAVALALTRFEVDLSVRTPGEILNEFCHKVRGMGRGRGGGRVDLLTLRFYSPYLLLDPLDAILGPY